MINEKFILDHVTMVDVGLIINKDNSFQRTVNIKIDDVDYSEWDYQYQLFIRNLPSKEVMEIFVYKLIETYGLNTIGIDDHYINKSGKIIEVKNLEFELGNSKIIKIVTPGLTEEFIQRLGENILKTRKTNLLNQHKNDTIDHIIIYPSNIMSEVMYYKEIKNEKKKNVLSFFNYKNNKPGDAFIGIENLIDDVVLGFLKEYSEKVESYIKKDDRLIITFAGDKSIELHDAEYINSRKEFFEPLQDILIDKNINKKNRR